MASKKDPLPAGMVQLTLSEDLVADLSRSIVKEVERATHKWRLHKSNMDRELEALQTALENLKAVNPDHEFFTDENQISLLDEIA